MKKILAMIAAVFAWQTGYAGNWYVGLGLGAARANDASENIAAGNSTLAQYGIGNITSYDDRSGALSLLGGYRFSEHVAADLAYTYLGSYDLHGFTAPGRTPPAGREENHIDALSLAAVFTAPVNDSLSLYAKLGPTLAMNEERTCVSNIRWCDSTSDTKNGLIFGVGGSVTFPRLIGELRLEVDRFSHAGDTHNEFTAGRLSLLQIQYVYSF
jgi:hypothetical protein